MKIFLCAAACCMLISLHAAGQTTTDTLRLDLPSAEKLFLDSNLALVAQHYNIDIGKALEQQARLWDNPYLQTDQNMYDGKWFRHTYENGQYYGQVYLQLQQVIRTGGKRNNLIKLAQDNTLTASQQFNDMMRNLKFLLETDFNNLYQLIETEALFSRGMSSLENLARGEDSLLAKGDISQKDNLRVKALLFSMQSGRNAYRQQIEDLETELRKLLARKDSVFILPVIHEQAVVRMETPALASLLDSARQNRPDIMLAGTALITNQHNLAYQKSQVYPDPTIGVEYDHNSSYTQDIWGLAIGLPLPILNRNTGNIRAARLAIKQSEAGYRDVVNRAEQEVVASYKKLQSFMGFQQDIPSGLDEGYDALARNMLESYRQRQISLIEFVDFFDSYRETRVNRLNQFATYRNLKSEINYTTASPIFKTL